MKTITRTVGAVASAGLLAVGGATAANAESGSSASFDAGSKAAATCYHAAQKPWIVGGVSNTAAGSATVYCVGGQVRVRVIVKLQKKVGARWVNQNPSTFCVGMVGGATKKCTETNGASPGLWRTWSKAIIVNNGNFNIAISGTTRFVPARNGVTM